jgi:large subunit ribosomal protein L32
VALPKKRHSKSRVKKSRQFWRLELPPLIPCPNCKTLKLSHHICPNCGYYKGRRIIEVKEKKKR